MVQNVMEHKCSKVNSGTEKEARVCKKSHAAHVLLVTYLQFSIVSTEPLILVGSSSRQRGGTHKKSGTCLINAGILTGW